MKTIIHNGHKIEVKMWFTEKVFYDGKQMTSMFTLFGGTHCFKVTEGNEDVDYEVQVFSLPRIGMKIRRNGVLIYTDK